MKKSDVTILNLLKSGDKSGLEMLFKEFYRPLVIYAMQFLSRKEDAEDLVQEVFIKLWETNRFLNIDFKLRAYIYQSVRNSCLNWLESKSKIQIDTIDSIPELTDDAMLDESDWKVYMDEIYQKIENLPPRTREIFTAIILENKKYKDVADDMGISVNTVKTSLSRALSNLRTNLSNKANIVLSLIL